MMCKAMSGCEDAAFVIPQKSTQHSHVQPRCIVITDRYKPTTRDNLKSATSFSGDHWSIEGVEEL